MASCDNLRVEVSFAMLSQEVALELRKSNNNVYCLHPSELVKLEHGCGFILAEYYRIEVAWFDSGYRFISLSFSIRNRAWLDEMSTLRLSQEDLVFM